MVNTIDTVATDRAQRVASRLLTALAARTPGRFSARPAPTGAPGWVGVDALVADPAAIEPLVAATAARYGTDDHALAVGQVVREAASIATGAAVTAWAREGRLLDWRAGNVALRPGPRGLVVGLRRPALTVAADDPVADDPSVTVAEDLLAALDAQLLGPAVPAGAVPPGPAAQVASVAATIAAARRAARTGARHHWGSAAIAAVVALEGHDAERAQLLARRPDLARTVEVADGGCARRLTCCLLVKLPDAPQCATCPLTPGAGRRLRPRGPRTAGPAAAPVPATGRTAP